MKVAERLQIGRDYLMGHSWHKGGFINGESVCALGAIKITQLEYWESVHDTGDGGYLPERAILDWVAMGLYGDRVRWRHGNCPVAQVNDHEDSTLSDVFHIYDEAIRIAKEYQL